MEKCIKIFGTLEDLYRQKAKDKQYYEGWGDLKFDIPNQRKLVLTNDRVIDYLCMADLPEKIRGQRAKFIIIDETVDKAAYEEELYYLNMVQI